MIREQEKRPEQRDSAAERGRAFLVEALKVAVGSVFEYFRISARDPKGIMRYIAGTLTVLGGSLLVKMNEYDPRFFERMVEEGGEMWQMVKNLPAGGSVDWNMEKNIWASWMIVILSILASAGYSVNEMIKTVAEQVRKKKERNE